MNFRVTILTEDKGTRKMVYFRSEKRYELFKAICRELDLSISEVLNILIDQEIERMIICVETYNKSKQKEIEKND